MKNIQKFENFSIDENKKVNEGAGHNCIDYKNLYSLGISFEDAEECEKIIDEVAGRRGDVGSCVIGGGLKANGKFIINPYSQGSLGPEETYKKIKEFLGPKYPNIKFAVEWGNMD